MAEENTWIQQEQTLENTASQSGITFEDILPWGADGGDTGLSSRLKLKRNFEKIKAWLDSSGSRFLSRLYNDIAYGHISFEQGLDALFAITDILRSNDYTGEGLFDKGFSIWNETEPSTGATYSHAIVDFLTVRLKAFFAQLELREISYVGGNFVFSPAGSKIYHVEWMTEQDEIIDKTSGFITGTDTPGVLHHFRCWFYSDDGTTATMNKWAINDQAQCRTFDIDTGVYENVASRFYWRLVTALGKSVIPTLTEEQEGYGKQFQYIDLSNVSGEHALDSGGSTPDASQPVITEDYPEAGDKIVQIGNWTDPDRQGVMYLQVCGNLAFFMYDDVGQRHFELPSPNIRISPKLGNIFKGKFFSMAGDDDIEDIIHSLIERLNDVQQQADKRFDIWFGAYAPMPQKPGDTANYPASEWNTPALKQLHTQDLFTDTRKEAATATAGRMWRYEAVADEEDPLTIWFLWREVTDRDTIAVKEQLTDVASDGIVSAGYEKSMLLVEWMKAVDSYNKAMTSNNLYTSTYTISGTPTVDTSALVTAMKAITLMLDGGDPTDSTAVEAVDLTTYIRSTNPVRPTWVGTDLEQDTPIESPLTVSVYRQTWVSFYEALAELNSKRMEKMVLGVNATFENTGSSLVSRVVGTELSLYDHEENGVTVKGLTTITAEHTVSLTSIESRISSSEGTISSLTVSIGSITSRVTSAEGTISQHTTDINGITSRVTSAEGNISQLSVSLNSISATVSNKASLDASLLAYVADNVSHLNLMADDIDFTFSNQWTVKAKDSGGTERTVLTLTPSGDLTISGKFHGQFDDNVTIGNSGNYRMRIEPTSTNGARLVGLDSSNDEVLTLGYTSVTIEKSDGSTHTTTSSALRLVRKAGSDSFYSSYQASMMVLNGSGNGSVYCHANVEPEMYLENGNGYFVIKVTSAGKAYIAADSYSSWFRSKSDAPVGGLYVDSNNFVKVRDI